MMKKSILYVFLGVLILMLIDACTKEEQENFSNNEQKIVLRWSKAYADEDQKKIETGLMWGFSFLGATLPVREGAFSWKDSKYVEVNIDKLGFSDEARDALVKISTVIKQNEEYRLKNGMDIGRFIMLIFNAPDHYYAITGAKKHLDLFTANYMFQTERAAIIESCVSKTHRLISFPQSEEIGKTAYMAAEGDGSLLDGTFIAKKYEVLDIMPNGQLRFAVYNEDGNLIAGVADTMVTNAGKAAKCLWCHEVNIQPPFYAVTSVADYMKPEEFKDSVLYKMNILRKFRNALTQGIDYGHSSEHYLLELLYISFTEPSAERLAEEWGLSVSEVKSRLSNLQTHIYPEFPYLGNLYNRSEVEEFSPYKGIRVSDSPREVSVYEPKFF
jgi:hypothetical protein